MKTRLRNLFTSIFNKKVERKYASVRMLSEYNSSFSTIQNDIYKSKIARECIDRIATQCGKFEIKHINEKKGVQVYGEINYLLSHQPNPRNNTYDFLYRIVSILKRNNNAFVYIHKDKTGFIKGFYPILAVNYDLYECEGELYIKCKFINGKDYYFRYSELIHLRGFYCKNDIFGEDNDVLKIDIETVQVASEGIKNAIKLSNNLKGLLKFKNAQLKSKDVKDSKDEFVKDFLNLENESGIAGLDARADFEPINLNPITLNKDQLQQVNENIYEYFGVNEHIIKNKFTEEEWNAFYEGVIEPIAIQMENEFTNKIFTKKAIEEGHKIVFSTNRMQYASLVTKIKLLDTLVPFGVFTKNRILSILELPLLTDGEGDKIIQSLNNIDASIANKYQEEKNNGK